MTEAEWVASDEPIQMLEFLHGPVTTEVREMYGRPLQFESYPHRKDTDRKLRLFSVGCCRRLLHLLDDEHCTNIVEASERLGCTSFLPDPPQLDSCCKAVDLAERYADEATTYEELRQAAEVADGFHIPSGQYAACYVDAHGPFDTQLMAAGWAAEAAHSAARTGLAYATAVSASAKAVVRQAATAVAYERGKMPGEVENGDAAERFAQAALLRDIFGPLPFRPVVFTPEWRTDTALTLARQMYDSRDFSAMPILADALQDAGCDNDDILDHCRRPGEHVRGCWVVDLVLGKT
jgi:hypothetical protein